MSLNVYSLGEGIVGKVAITGKHMWISTDKHVLDSCSLLESFSDLWVDFLLKETEERERANDESTQDQQGADPSTAGSLISSRTTTSHVAASGLSRWSSPLNQDPTPLLPHRNL